MKKLILMLLTVCAIGSSTQLSAAPKPPIPAGNQPFMGKGLVPTHNCIGLILHVLLMM